MTFSLQFRLIRSYYIYYFDLGFPFDLFLFLCISGNFNLLIQFCMICRWFIAVLLDVCYFLSYDIVFLIFLYLLSRLLFLYMFLLPLLSFDIALFYYILLLDSSSGVSPGIVSLYLFNNLYIQDYWASIDDIMDLIVSLEGSRGCENVAFVLGCSCDISYFIYAQYSKLFLSNLLIINSLDELINLCLDINYNQYREYQYSVITMKNNLKQMMNSFVQLVKTNPKTSLAIALPILLGIIIRKQQRRIIYIPQIPGMDKSPSNNPHPYRNPTEFGLPNSKDIQIKTSDNIKLRGWYVSPNDKKPSRLILYYQQNAGNIGARLPFVKHLVQQTNSDVMLVAYRGYSDSEGVPSQKGLKNDGISILDVAIKESNQRKIPLVVLGRSLGGAVAIYCCSQQKSQQHVKGLVLQNTFTSISDVGLNLFGTPKTRFIIKFIFFFLLSNHWESYKLIEKIKAPTFFIKSALDELIPIEQMNKLQQKCQSKKMSYTIRRGTHNESWSVQFEEYFNRLNRFLSSL